MEQLVPRMNSLEGQIIKWAKGHYKDKTFDQVVTAYTGWTGKHGEREKCRIMMRALVESGQMKPSTMDQIVESFFYWGAIDAHRVTSYHVTYDDRVKANCLSQALFQALRDMRVNDVIMDESGGARINQPLVVLPEQMPDSAFKEDHDG